MGKDVLSTVLTLLAEKLGRERFDLWFGAHTRFTLTGSNLLVETPNQFLQDWQRQHYRETLEAVCRQALASEAAESKAEGSNAAGSNAVGSKAAASEVVSVEFRVNESLAAVATSAAASDAVTSDAQATGAAASSCAPAKRGVNVARSQTNEKHGPRATQPAANGNHAVSYCTTVRPHRPATQIEPQATAEISITKSCGKISAQPTGHAAAVNGQSTAGEMLMPRRRFATLAAFVVGTGNRLAHASAQMVAERPGSLTPLLVYGPHGSGKTHLLEGIWSAARAQTHGLNCVYLSAEQFTTFFVGAARGGGMPSFRRKYRAVDLLLIDDLQFLAGRKGTLVELLHTIDTALREGRQLVFAADRAPADLSGLGPELSTRLAGGMVCPLEQPDQQTRFGLVQQFGRRLGIELSDDVAEFVAAQVTAGARELCGAVNRLHACSRMLGCSIDRAFSEETLADMLRQAGRAVRLADIERAVCHVFQLPKESLQSQRRAKHVSAARTLAMWLARKYTRAGLAEIGQYFGRRSHSTVISAHKRVTGWIAGQSEIELSDFRCKVDEALRRVEAQLRTG
jgi:chromosomal replication initiator protein